MLERVLRHIRLSVCICGTARGASYIRADMRDSIRQTAMAPSCCREAGVSALEKGIACLLEDFQYCVGLPMMSGRRY
jgi:hypothetical protein